MAAVQTTKPAPKRFASLNEDEYDEIIKNKDSEATLRSTRKAVNVFRSYLSEKKLPQNFEALSKSELDSVLCKFYVEVRKVDGDYYKTASMNSLRAGICRYVKDNGKSGVDIIKDTEFAQSTIAFKAALVKLKSIGKGDTVHHSDIDENDLSRLYSSGVLNDNNPYGLQHKVWFELMLYICRRGRENLRKLRKDHFSVATDSDGRKYVFQSRDEMTKKVREDNANSRVDGGRMYATGTVGCPVVSFEKYISKLNPTCDLLFQTPKAKTPQNDEEPWYKNSPVGQTQLGKMMSIISKEAELSKIYTNHCLRSTCISILDSNGFANRDICSVSGHQNESSITSYVGRVSDNKKQSMSSAISTSIGHVQQSTRPASPELEAEPTNKQDRPLTATSTELFSDSQLALLEPHILDMMDTDDREAELSLHNDRPEAAAARPTAPVNLTSKNMMQTLQQHPMVLNNCNVTINYNFNNSQ